MVYLNVVCADNYRDPGCPGPADAATYVSLPVVETGSTLSSRTVSGSGTPTSGSGTPTSESVTETLSSTTRSTPGRASPASVTST